MGTGIRTAAFFSVLGMLVAGISNATAQEFTDVSTDFTALGETYVRDGVFLPLSDIRHIQQSGERLTKNEVAARLGAPNDSSSTYQDSRWLYNINLPLSGDNYLVCQYRVSFSQEVMTGFEWRRQQCQNRFNELSEPQEYTLSADLLFAFDSAAISSDGVRAITQIASEIRQYFETPTITVLGYTDRIGNNNYNMRLSERRAESVATALINGGVNPGWIEYEGRGASDPIVSCEGVTGERLKECLAPNRRVYISLYEEF